MKAMILAGGLGTRLAEETQIKPKPMVEIGGRPILLHIMNIIASGGVKDFYVACGYKGEVIKEYFANYHLHYSNLSVDMQSNTVDLHGNKAPDWKVHLIDTGVHSQTGGRVKRLEPWLKDGPFIMTYGDGVGNIDVSKLLAFHHAHGKLATITAVRPPARFGGLEFDGDHVARFLEKPQIGEGWINGGYMVLEPEVFSYIDGDDTILEHSPMERLAEDGQLMAYKHEGFWQPMDTLREKQLLEELWQSGNAPWKVWDE